MAVALRLLFKKKLHVFLLHMFCILFVVDLLKVDDGGHQENMYSLNSPSLPLSNPQGQTEECIFLIIESLRATIEGTGYSFNAVH